MFTQLHQGVISRNPLHTKTCNLTYTDLLMNPDRMPKTRSVWPTLRVKIRPPKKVAVNIDIFKRAEPHSPWDAHSVSTFSKTAIDVDLN